MSDLKSFKNRIEKELKKAPDLEEIEAVWRKYFGRKGEITAKLRELKNMAEKERKTMGSHLNEIKKEMEHIFAEQKNMLELSKYKEQIKKEWIDVTRPGIKKSQGSLHPLTKTLQEMEDIFAGMGFEAAHGPQIETEWNNFDSLNIPASHPARDLWDTFWVKQTSANNKTNKREQERLLLRTHTSAMQAQYMSANKPPFRVVFPGRVFRHEATDASHEMQFYQFEGLMVDDHQHISAANFRAIINEFYSKFFNTQVKTRLRPSFFPFVEPGFEIDISCVHCNQKGCSACSHSGWLEMMGAGMVHPKVFKAAGYNPKYLTGFAFGMGVDRLAMIKYRVDDVRLFYGSDLRFLKQFK